jgi:Glycerophosphoryl diester phosphodiesterase
MSRPTRIAAHRGGAQLWPENSRLAFRNAVAMDVDFIEFDVHRTRDGVLVVHHDPLLGRTCEGEGVIADMEWDDLRHRGLHGTDGETVPTLSEVLDIFASGRPALRLEIKYRQDRSRYPGIEGEILSALDERGVLHRTTITAFDLEVLRSVVSLSPDRPTIHLVRSEEYRAGGRQILEYARKARDAGGREIAIRVEDIQEGDVELCETVGVALGVYAAHDIPSIEKAYDLGVSAFTTDRPDLAISVRSRQFV